MPHPARARRVRHLICAARLGLPILALALLASGAAPRAAKRATPAASSTRVLLIGVDAADWNMIRPLMAAGRMPNMKRLVEQGASGPNLTLQPLEKSPVIWATIATGKAPQKHGISDFLTGNIPTTSNQWCAKPIWDVLGSAGHSVGVVGWYTTWPAQPVNGVLVSDYVAYARGMSTQKIENLAYPTSLAKLVAKESIDPRSVTTADIRGFLSADPDTMRLLSETQNALDEFKWIYSADLTLARTALVLYRERQPDFFTVYLRGVDETSHHFWNYQQVAPVKMTNPLNASEVQGATLFRDLSPRYYAMTDSLIGEFVRAADARTTIVICSDHGFQGGQHAMGVAAHRVEGILVLTGRGIAPVAISGATVYDITPTILAMFGLPRATDMDGVVLTEALAPGVFPPVRGTIPSYGAPQYAGAAGKKPIPSPVDEELKEKLKSLGYINK